MNKLKVPGLADALAAEEIIWIEGEGNYAWLHLVGRKRLLVCQTLLWFETRLGSFVRVHQGALVNPAYVSLVEYRSSRWAQLHLRNGTKVIIARRRIACTVDRFPIS